MRQEVCSFLKKRTKKLLPDKGFRGRLGVPVSFLGFAVLRWRPYRGLAAWAAKQTGKVFCFFFAKKGRFLALPLGFSGGSVA